jgi:hypothetical protein
VADIAKRVGPTAVGTSAATVYTVPGATVLFVRQIHVSNTTGAEIKFSLSIGADAAATELFSAYPISGNDVLDWTGNIPLLAAEIIQAKADLAGLTLTIGGVEST